MLSFHVPYAYMPLLLNTLTQVICASGVHRLTTRVSSLTVTLILVIRKAVSLVLSVLGAGIVPGIGGGKARSVDQGMMWVGAAFVLVGTILYSIGTGGKKGGGTMIGKAVEKGKKE
jgi:UDP-xylose/UDP-N-acetylglucosamine transporter B4